MIVFEEKEVVFDYDDANGKLKLSIPIEVILKKLGKRKIKYKSGYYTKEDVEQAYFPKLSGVDFHIWISMNFEQTKSQKRSLNVYAKLLKDLVKLREAYGPDRLNDAMIKCNTPLKCTIAYLKAILRNNNPKEMKNDGKYQKNIESAIRRFM
jgi:hypothetical protein